MSERDKQFSRALESAYPKVLAFCNKLTRGCHTAEDLAQSAALRAWQARNSFDEKLSSVSTWVSHIAKNIRTDEYRSSKAVRRTAVPPLSTSQLPNQVDATYLSQTIEAIKKLPNVQQEAVKDLALEVPHAEIAARSGQALGTIKGRQRLARINLERLGFN